MNQIFSMIDLRAAWFWSWFELFIVEFSGLYGENECENTEKWAVSVAPLLFDDSNLKFVSNNGFDYVL